MPRGQFARAPSGHGMSAGETAIMDLWDGGASAAEIASETGYGARYVEQVAARHNVSTSSLNAFDKMVVFGSHALLDAIRKHHPEMVRGSPQ